MINIMTKHRLLAAVIALVLILGLMGGFFGFVLPQLRHSSVPCAQLQQPALALSTQSVTCVPPPSPTTTLTAACPQPQPAPGQITLAGLGYGPYHTGQDPNAKVFPSSQEVAADMPTLAALSRYIRIYSSQNPADAIVKAANTNHLCVALGIWLGKDEAANTKEIMAGAQLATSSNAVHSVIVGNEVLLRGDMSEKQLHEAIQQVRTKLGRSVQISMADDYNQWLAHPELAKDVDFITVHIYPFWQQVSINGAMQVLKDAYQRVVKKFPSKPVVIGETGWPSAGPPQGAAVPSEANQARYFREFVSWAKQQNMLYFYFSAFDEKWKVNEAGVGAHWGLYQDNGVVKHELSNLIPNAAPETLKERSYLDVYVGGLETSFGLGLDTSNQQRQWLTDTGTSLKLDYPTNQAWGTMFITVGSPSPPGNRPSLDLSAYKSLVVDIRAGTAGACVRLGIKDRTQSDDVSETTVSKCLTTQWSTLMLPLNAFVKADLSHLYVVFEIVFDGPSSASVELSNIRYSPFVSTQPIATPTPIVGTQPTPTPVVGTQPIATPTSITNTEFAVYRDAGAAGNHYVPSGEMGDFGDITTTENWGFNPHSGKTCIQVIYSGAASGGNGWAGVYWQDPENNWGEVPGGYDLSHFPYLSFWVRGKVGGEKIEFKVGGITGPYGDSLQPAATTGVITLTTSWQQVTLNLTGNNLTHIIGGFVWVTNTTQNPHGATFFLDDIAYL